MLFFLSCTNYLKFENIAVLDMNLLRIPKGSFFMGGTNELAIPLHRVTITEDFWLADGEVTQQSFGELMGFNPSPIQDPRLPVAGVRWEEALVFCNRLSQQEGHTPCYKIDEGRSQFFPSCTGYRLPTEAEWEYAAKSGTQMTYAGHPLAQYVGWFKEHTTQAQLPRQKRPNMWGLYDMSGNVAEWVFDGFVPYSTQARIQPQWDGETPNRISRGGAWNSYSVDVPLSTRSIESIDWRFEWLGFRIAKNIAVPDD